MLRRLAWSSTGLKFALQTCNFILISAMSRKCLSMKILRVANNVLCRIWAPCRLQTRCDYWHSVQLHYLLCLDLHMLLLEGVYFAANQLDFLDVTSD
jgi:hypothetical protein